MFAITGADLSNALKQANEFQLAPAQYLATPITYLSDVNALGLGVAHGLTFMQSWYWDLNDRTREFAKRFYARRGRMPNDNQVALYSSVRHYLEAVAKAGTDDAAAVMKAMREAPIRDVFTDNGTIRADGRVLYDRYLMFANTPAESKYPWTISPSSPRFPPPTRSGCPAPAAARWVRSRTTFILFRLISTGVFAVASCVHLCIILAPSFGIRLNCAFAFQGNLNACIKSNNCGDRRCSNNCCCGAGLIFDGLSRSRAAGGICYGGGLRALAWRSAC